MVTFMGGVRSHTLILILGLAALALTLFFAIRRKVWLTVGALFLLTCLMVVMRDMVRTEYLKPYFHPSNLTVVQDYSPLILFLGCLVIGLGITAYVIRLALKTGRTPALSPSENAP
jgi:branched-subunit amino acid ABC-type transport system permease component